MRPLLILLMAALMLTTAQARFNETEQEIEARYGKAVCESAYREIDRNRKPPAFEENYRPDGTPKDLPQDDGLYLARTRLVSFDSETQKWVNFESSVIGRSPNDEDTAILRQVTLNTKKHLRQRFYILNDIAISVVYFDGRSVSESYKEKNVHLPADAVDTLIKKSFPDLTLVDEKNTGGHMRLVRIMSSDYQQLHGCATYIAGDLTISGVLYYEFLKAMEVQLKQNTEMKQQRKLDGF